MNDTIQLATNYIRPSTMRMHLSIAEGRGPFAGIVVIQHQWGLDEFMQSITERLAQAGYVAAAPDLYHRRR